MTTSPPFSVRDEAMRELVYLSTNARAREPHNFPVESAVADATELLVQALRSREPAFNNVRRVIRAGARLMALVPAAQRQKQLAEAALHDHDPPLGIGHDPTLWALSRVGQAVDDRQWASAAWALAVVATRARGEAW